MPTVFVASEVFERARKAAHAQRVTVDRFVGMVLADHLGRPEPEAGSKPAPRDVIARPREHWLQRHERERDELDEQRGLQLEIRSGE